MIMQEEGLPNNHACIVSDVISYFFPEAALIGRLSASFLSQLKYDFLLSHSLYLTQGFFSCEVQ